MNLLKFYEKRQCIYHSYYVNVNNISLLERPVLVDLSQHSCSFYLTNGRRMSLLEMTASGYVLQNKHVLLVACSVTWQVKR